MHQVVVSRGPVRNRAGFTLAELLIVISVLGVLSSVVVFSVGGISDRGQGAACAEDARTVRLAVETYKANNGALPTNQAALVSGGMLSQASVLNDFAVSGTTYTMTPLGVCIAASGATTTQAPIGTTTTTGPRATINGGSDQFANATVVPPLATAAITTVNVDGTGYTTETGEPWVGGQGYATAWFAYSPAVDQSIRLQTSGYADSGGQSWIGVYRGSALGALTTLVQWSGRSAVFSVTAGSTYRVHVFTQQGHGTTGTVQFIEGSVAGPDAFAGAINVGPMAVGGSQTVSIDGTGYLSEPGEPWVGGQGYATAWFAYTPTTDQSIRVQYTGYADSGGQAWIGVYRGSALGALTTLEQWSGRNAVFSVSAGQTYRVQIFTQSGHGTAGSVQFLEGSVAGPDAFAGATVVNSLPSGGSQVVNVDGTNTTTEPGEPWVGGQGYSTVWLAYTPAADQSIRLTTTGYSTGGGSNWIGIYRGSSLGSLTTITQVGNRYTSFTAAAGQTYRIQIFTQLGLGTTGTVLLQEGAAGGPDLFAGATVVSPVAAGASVSTSIDTSSASAEQNEPWVGGQGYSTVWLKYAPTTSQPIALSVTGATVSGNVWIGVYDGTALGALTTLRQQGGRNTALYVVAGHQYRFQIFTQYGQGAAGALNITDGSNTPDMFANAIAVNPLAPGANSSTNIDVTGATAEPTEPWIGTQPQYGGVWLAYTPVQSETIQIDTTGYTSSGTWIGVYRGSVLTSLVTMVQAGGRTATFSAVAGQTYRIQVFTQIAAGTVGIVTLTAS